MAFAPCLAPSRCLLKAVALILLCTDSPWVTAEDTRTGYQLGRGYALGNTGIRLGGYASLHSEGARSSPWTTNLNDLSLFVTWDGGGKLRYFSETEAENSLDITQHRQLTDGINFRLERLYVDYLATERITFRIGKVLTPVGQWNMIHVDPLVWTTTRPVATETLFAEHATGITLQGVIPVSNRALEYAVYSDFSSTLDPKRSDGLNFSAAQGIRLRSTVYDSLQIGLSYLDFALLGESASRNHLAGVDFAWSYQRFALNSEIVYRHADAGMHPDRWQGYIQSVSPLSSDLSAVIRYEFFDPPQGMKTLGQAEVLGFAYRPQSALILKLEYRLGQHNRELAPDGLFASFSVLF
jgi:hypothetical protein